MVIWSVVTGQPSHQVGHTAYKLIVPLPVPTKLVWSETVFQALSRTDLIEHVWDFAYDGDSNVVEVYVRYLREKVDRPFGRASLETVRGLGYRLRDDGPS